jgi:hypothetical protein
MKTREILRSDAGVQSMARLNAILTDWYNNIEQERRGVRACERISKFRKNTLFPTANRYFEYITNDSSQNASELLNEWEDDFRPDYVSESDEKKWDTFDCGLTRTLLDAENRIGSFAVDTAKDVSDVTINIYDENKLCKELQDAFDKLWRPGLHRLHDLYWERRGRIYKQIVKQMEKGHIELEDETWEKHKKRYPKLPRYTVIAGETIY